MQSYQELAAVVADINDRIECQGSVEQGIPIQKAFSTPHYITLGLRFIGHTYTLYLGRGGEYGGLYGETSSPPALYRVRDRYLEYIRKHLRGGLLTKIMLDPGDRIVAFHYLRSGKLNIFQLFWRGRVCYFSNCFYNEEGIRQVFLSWRKSSVEDLDLYNSENIGKTIFNIFDSVGRRNERMANDQVKPLSSQVSSATLIDYFEKLDTLSKSAKPIGRVMRRKSTFFKRKIGRIEADIQRVAAWRELEQLLAGEALEIPDGEIIDGQERVTLCGIKIKFTRGSGFYQKRDHLYQIIKKYRRVEQELSQRLVATQNDFAKWEVAGNKLDHADFLSKQLISPYWKVDQKPADKTSRGGVQFNYHRFTLPSGEKMVLGLDAASNDHLRISWAKRDDFWFHIEGERSGHLIIRSQNISRLLTDYLGLIGAILAEFSGYRGGEVPIIYTQVKYLRGVKGERGAVIPRKAHYIQSIPAQNWREIIAFN
ncbi:MAG: hypothetical protein HN353_03330 [Bdellovibrionales bacterium]|jgi:predicted ribosome quality control (RQC) complex YloA/Tae2 family protein|nr:hypothetical protein [Bdellovibrionales bacterium]MBT3526084.1 hypothetical protein [Bdellovibrionales bacterium]MBT7670181.1 hypothetical protein [Bdellovibrionales bacterium]